jgi:hypothetical protein
MDSDLASHQSNHEAAVITVQNLRETNLAWALIDAAKPLMNARERNDVFVIIGAGDTFAAIRRLFKLVVAKQIPLHADLVRRCSTWLDTYSSHEEEQHLRRLIARFLIGYSAKGSTTMRIDLVSIARPLPPSAHYAVR